MLEIKIKGESLDLQGKLNIGIEETSPVFNDTGAQSVPVTVPATPRNARVLGWPQRIDSALDPNSPMAMAEVISGTYRRSGLANVVEASRREGISFNIGFDNSTAYAAWTDRKLADLKLPKRKFASLDEAYDFCQSIFEHPYPDRDEFAVFPVNVAVQEKETGSGDSKSTTKVFHVLNELERGENQGRKLIRATVLEQFVNGELTEVSVPDLYKITPFIRVWRLLELAFADFGVTVESNPFRTDPDLARLVVLNNTADALCTGTLDYADIMPDCTVAELLNSLWVRFGFVYNIRYDKGTVTLKFLKDILRDDAVPVTQFTTGFGKITFDSPRYLKLSAKTSLEGAAPATPTFEEFARGIDLGNLAVGSNVSEWDYVDHDDDSLESGWDGDALYLDSLWDPDDSDYPDPPDPDYRDDPYDDDDERDEERYDDGYDGPDYAPRREASPAVERAKTPKLLGREWGTDNWYRLDEFNGVTKLTTTSFFDWDPQSDGLDALELAADDEFVPTANVAGHGLLPQYLEGCRHYHSYISADGDDDEGCSTPLAFMLGLDDGSGTSGRNTPETPQGTRWIYPDGSEAGLSLLFQFRNGLFNRYWRDYDELLRHGLHTVETELRMPKTALCGLDMLKPVILRGVRCLPDTLSYSIGSAPDSICTMRLRTIQPSGQYDIGAEQNVPQFDSLYRHSEWRLKWTTIKTDQVLISNLNRALEQALKEIKWKDYQQTIDGSSCDVTINIHSLMASGLGIEPGANPEDDRNIPVPSAFGQRWEGSYPVHYHYNVYPVYRHVGSTGAWTRRTTSVGSVSIDWDYRLQLVARWVQDSPLEE